MLFLELGDKKRGKKAVRNRLIPDNKLYKFCSLMPPQPTARARQITSEDPKC